MRKQKTKSTGSKGHGADVWASPEMSALDGLLRQVTQVPKSELDRLLDLDKGKRNGHQK
jgi:hypothetical protein